MTPQRLDVGIARRDAHSLKRMTKFPEVAEQGIEDLIVWKAVAYRSPRGIKHPTLCKFPC